MRQPCRNWFQAGEGPREVGQGGDNPGVRSQWLRPGQMGKKGASDMLPAAGSHMNSQPVLQKSKNTPAPPEVTF